MSLISTSSSLSINRSYRRFLYLRCYRPALIACAAVLLMYMLARYLGCDFTAFTSNAAQINRFIMRFIHPDFSFISRLIPSMIQTVLLAASASLLGLFLSLPLALGMAKKSSGSVYLSAVSSACTTCLRSIPSLVWASLLVSLFSVGILSGFFALTLIMSLQGSKLLKEYIDGLNENIFISCAALGISRIEQLRHGIFPALYEEFISVGIILFEGGVRGAAVLGLVGAGGVGQLLQQQLAYLRYDRLSLIILSLFILVFLCDSTSYALRSYLKRKPSVSLSSGFLGAPTGYHFYRAKKLTHFAAFCLPLVCVVFFLSQMNLPSIDRVLSGIGQLKPMLVGLMYPDWRYTATALPALLEGFSMAFFASLASFVIALCVVSLSFGVQSFSLHSWVIKLAANILRSFPTLIFAVIFLIMVGPGPFAGVLALSFYTTGVLIRYYNEKFEALHPVELMSYQALGISSLRIFVCLVLRQYKTLLMSLGLYRFESNIRNAAILGMVGAGGIGFILENNIKYRNWDKVSLVLIMVVSLSILVDRCSLILRKKID